MTELAAPTLVGGTPRLLPFGDRALLMEVDTLEQALALYPALRAASIPGITDLVPAARSILVSIDPRMLSLHAARTWALSVRPGVVAASTSELVHIDVTYDGDDLAHVAGTLGITTDDLVAWHTSTSWSVAFIGFAPGFAYLSAATGSGRHSASGGGGLDVPRRATSRPVVPAGSVGLAGEFSGIYPRSSPGGWQLIGRTDAVLWDETRANPALLAPGARVQFRAVEGRRLGYGLSQ